MYKFTQDVHSLATGKDYRKGQRVPANFEVKPSMVGSLVELDELAESAEIERQAPDYETMEYKELGELMDNRNLDFERSKDARINRLKEADKLEE